MHPIKMDYQSILFYYEEEVTLTYNTENASYENGFSTFYVYPGICVYAISKDGFIGTADRRINVSVN